MAGGFCNPDSGRIVPILDWLIQFDLSSTCIFSLVIFEFCKLSFQFSFKMSE